jgi:O-antigen/teichoic acid export membrane protein
MSNEKFNLTPQQKLFRGTIFIAAGIFLIVQVGMGESAAPIWVFISWGSAFVAFGALMAFLWSMRKKK